MAFAPEAQELGGGGVQSAGEWCTQTILSIPTLSDVRLTRVVITPATGVRALLLTKQAPVSKRQRREQDTIKSPHVRPGWKGHREERRDAASPLCCPRQQIGAMKEVSWRAIVVTGAAVTLPPADTTPETDEFHQLGLVSPEAKMALLCFAFLLSKVHGNDSMFKAWKKKL